VSAEPCDGVPSTTGLYASSVRTCLVALSLGITNTCTASRTSFFIMWAVSFTNWLVRVTQVDACIALLILPHEYGQAFMITRLAALLIVFVAMGRHPSLPTLATVEGERLATPELMSW